MSDYIKRSDVINLLWYFQDECCSAVIGDFEKLPSANRPQGEWKRMKFTDCGSPVHKCSICGHYINGDVEVRNFCPNCGARMKGADDE